MGNKIENEFSLKTKPTLKKLRMGKNCYEKEKLSLIELVINQI